MGQREGKREFVLLKRSLLSDNSSLEVMIQGCFTAKEGSLFSLLALILLK